MMVRDFLITISKIAFQTFKRKVERETDFECDKKLEGVIQLTEKKAEEQEIKTAA
jgi:hypothetical protein